MALQDEWAALEEQAGAMVPQLGGVTGDVVQPLWRGPDLLRKEATRLAAREARPLEAFGPDQARAYEWAAERGINLTKHEDHIKKIDLTRQGPSLDDLNPLDLDGYLRKHHTDAISSAIQEAQKQTEREFRQQYTRAIEQDWEETKRKILDSLGHKTAKRGAPMLQQTLPTALPRALPAPAGYGNGGSSTALVLPSSQSVGQPPRKQRRILDVSTERYGGVVKRMAENHKSQAAQRMAGPFQMLAQAQGQMGQLAAGRPQRADKTTEFWNLAAHIVGEARSPQTQNIPIPREGQFRKAWRAQDPAVCRQLLNLSRKSLEHIYEEHIKRTIASNQALAERGGRPEFEWDVIGFLRVNYNNAWDGYGFTDFVHLPHRRRVPVWPLVYFCFRCGHLDAACRVLSGQISGGHQPSNGRLMGSVLDALRAGQPISEELYQRLRQDYDIHIKTSNDTYLQAMYLLAGRCDQNASLPAKTTGVNASIEDYLWVKGVLARDTQEQLPSWMAEASAPNNAFARTELSVIQRVIREQCGPTHFTDGEDPFLYTKVLIFTQQYEEAVNHLYKTEKQVEAVHLMLALDHYGLLRTIRPQSLGRDQHEAPNYVDIAQRVYQYVLPMVPVDPALAFHYIYLLEGIEDQATFNSLLTETLLLKSASLETLVGTLHSGTVVLNGVIPRFLGVRRCCKLLREEASAIMHQHGGFQEAVKLKILGGDFANAAVVLTKALGRFMARKPQNPDKKAVLNLANEFLLASDRSMQHPDANSGNVFHINQADANKSNGDNLQTAIMLANFFNFFHQGPSGYQQALGEIQKADILPLRQLQTDANGQRRAALGRSDSHEMEVLRDRASRLKHCIQRNIPEVCLCVMRIWCYQHNHHKTNLATSYNPQALQQTNNMLLMLRSQASALLRFYTSPNLNIPIDATVNAEMNRLETTMRS